jgi:hypothetical protein
LIDNTRAFEEIQRLKEQLELQNTYLEEEVVEAKAFGDLLGQSRYTPTSRSSRPMAGIAREADPCASSSAKSKWWPQRKPRSSSWERPARGRN